MGGEDGTAGRERGQPRHSQKREDDGALLRKAGQMTAGTPHRGGRGANRKDAAHREEQRGWAPQLAAAAARAR